MIDHDNPASWRVAEKLGYVLEDADEKRRFYRLYQAPKGIQKTAVLAVRGLPGGMRRLQARTTPSAAPRGLTTPDGLPLGASPSSSAWPTLAPPRRSPLEPRQPGPYPDLSAPPRPRPAAQALDYSPTGTPMLQRVRRPSALAANAPFRRAAGQVGDHLGRFFGGEADIGIDPLHRRLMYRLIDDAHDLRGSSRQRARLAALLGATPFAAAGADALTKTAANRCEGDVDDEDCRDGHLERLGDEADDYSAEADGSIATNSAITGTAKAAGDLDGLMVDPACGGWSLESLVERDFLVMTTPAQGLVSCSPVELIR